MVTVGMEGRFTLKAPWTIDANKFYEVIAIREFVDIYRGGEDVYKKIYEPRGLTDGIIVGTETFNFQAEFDKKPLVVTLKATTGELIYVPTTYILGFPDSSEVPYKQVLLSVNLGALPDYVDVDILIATYNDLALNALGVNATTYLAVHPVVSNPTIDQHTTMENGRQANISVNSSSTATIDLLNQQMDALRQQIQTMTAILLDNDLL